MMLGLLLVLAAAGLAPLECPAGAERRGAAPPEGYAEWCEAPGPDGKARREGPARTYYDDGGLWLEESYHEGKRDGPSLERHRGGAPAQEGRYAQGRKVGRWTVWFSDGKLEEESTWKGGLLHGSFVSRWRSGALRTTGRYCLGTQCGMWKSFDERGSQLGAVEYAEQREEP